MDIFIISQSYPPPTSSKIYFMYLGTEQLFFPEGETKYTKSKRKCKK